LFDRKTKQRINPAQDINIGNHVCLGHAVKVFKGCSIGHGSVIDSDSRVTSSIPENCNAGGQPAVIIRENITWTKEAFQQLPSEYWD
ncbi:MAG: acyltransferase, partial [Pseudomonadales bacterium]|nr:acyltransferase [Pseudomonadales bacterium]